MSNFRPMLAAALVMDPFGKLIPGQISWPRDFYASPKIDGIRAFIQDRQVLSRTLKQIPNQEIQNTLRSIPHRLDGELVIPGVSFQETTSFVMSKNSTNAPWVYYVFDWYGDTSMPYSQRHMLMLQKLAPLNPQKIIPILHTPITTEEGLQQVHKGFLAQGYEGTILRHPLGPYKQGRSTISQGYMLKLKELCDAEAVILDIVPLRKNLNAPKLNKLGYTVRASTQIGLIQQPKMGALKVRAINGPYKDVEFEIGTGFTDTQRHLYYANPPIGEICTFTYQGHGAKNSPRFPTFKGIREDIGVHNG